MKTPGLNCFARRRSQFFKIYAVIPFVVLLLVDANSICAGAVQNGSAQANAVSQKAAPEPGQVSGHVYRSDTGAPIVKAEVALIPVKSNSDVTQDTRLFALTDAEGAFTISHVSAGTYTIVANHSGFVSRKNYSGQQFEESQTFRLSSAQILDKIDVRLVPAGVISGTISDEDNQPIAAVMVEAVRLRYARGGRLLDSSQTRVLTDDLGNFRLYGLPPGNYFVRAEVDRVSAQVGKVISRLAYYPGTVDVENAQPIKVTPGNEASGIRVSIGPVLVYSITGNIIDPTGSAGQGRYQITAMNSTDAANNGGRITTATSVAGGSFTLRGLPSGTYNVWAMLLEDRSDKSSTPDVSGSATVRIVDSDARANVQVSLEVDVSGKIAIETTSGRSVSGMSIVLAAENNSIDDPDRTRLKSVTDQRGNFKITYVPSGSYEFKVLPDAGVYLKRVVCNGKDHTGQPLMIEGGASVGDCILTLGSDTGTVKGQVLDGDKPVPGQTVVAIPEDRAMRHLERFTITANTNANGEFQLSGVIPGDYLLFAVPTNDDHAYFAIDFADRNQRDAEHVSVKSGEIKTLQLKPITPQ